MRISIPIIFCLLFLNGVVSADNTPNGLPLILMNSIASESHPGDMIQLQESSGQHCRFVGELTTSGKPDTLFKQFVAAGGGNSGNWSIMISRRTCSDGVMSKVALTVHLKLMPGPDDYLSGSTVIAFPGTLGSQ